MTKKMPSIDGYYWAMDTIYITIGKISRKEYGNPIEPEEKFYEIVQVHGGKLWHIMYTVEIPKKNKLKYKTTPILCEIKQKDIKRWLFGTRIDKD